MTAAKDITGCEPEDFETIARRVLADIPESKGSLGIKSNGLIILTAGEILWIQ